MSNTILRESVNQTSLLINIIKQEEIVPIFPYADDALFTTYQ